MCLLQTHDIRLRIVVIVERFLPYRTDILKTSNELGTYFDIILFLSLILTSDLNVSL